MLSDGSGLIRRNLRLPHAALRATLPSASNSTDWLSDLGRHFHSPGGIESARFGEYVQAAGLGTHVLDPGQRRRECLLLQEGGVAVGRDSAFHASDLMHPIR